MPADVDALNYPYIRVRSAEWLKRTLLIFPHVARMTPNIDAPADDPEVEQFTRQHGARAPLLRAAHLWEPHVQDAQGQLIRQLETLFAKDNSLLPRFQRGADRDGGQTERHLTVWERRLSAHASFQIHQYKMSPELVRYLVSKKLAWQPRAYISDGNEYLEMNPVLGEAIMATLAVACAENEGLHVVTEFPELHGKLLGVPRDAILATSIEGPPSSGRTSAQQIAEFLVYRRCDVSKVTAESLAALKGERDLLARFRTRLEELASTLPPVIHSKKTLEERLNDVLSDMFQEWRRDQANLSNYARRVFGEDILKAPEKLIDKLVESVANRDKIAAAAGAAGATGVAANHFGGLTIGIASGAVAGFAVAIVFHAVEAWRDTRRAARESSFRYLTTLEKHGVVFSLASSQN